MERDLGRDLWSAAVLAASILIANVAAAEGEIAKTPSERTSAPAQGMAAASVLPADAGANDAIPLASAEGIAAPNAPYLDAGAAGAIVPAPAQETAVATAPPAGTAAVTSASPETRSAFDDLSLSQLLDVSVVSSKRFESIADAPSSITVITADKIAALGLKTLNDVLQLVPGFDVRRSRQQLQLITVRGLSPLAASRRRPGRKFFRAWSWPATTRMSTLRTRFSVTPTPRRWSRGTLPT